MNDFETCSEFFRWISFQKMALITWTLFLELSNYCATPDCCKEKFGMPAFLVLIMKTLRLSSRKEYLLEIFLITFSVHLKPLELNYMYILIKLIFFGRHFTSGGKLNRRSCGMKNCPGMKYSYKWQTLIEGID